jgi:hypothetical protein
MGINIEVSEVQPKGGTRIYINIKILKQVSIPVHMGNLKMASHLQK